MGIFAQVAAFTSAGFLHRKGLQYHWRNRDRSNSNTNIDNNSNDKSNSGNNNGATTGAATTSTAVSGDTVGALSTGTPSEAAQQAVVVGEGGEPGDNKMYRDFDAYLGNFASKRRIKVRSN